MNSGLNMNGTGHLELLLRPEFMRRCIQSPDAKPIGAPRDHEPERAGSADFQSAVSRTSSPPARQSGTRPAGSRRYGRSETCATSRQFVEMTREAEESSLRRLEARLQSEPDLGQHIRREDADNAAHHGGIQR
jgi:hypothetical protein